MISNINNSNYKFLSCLEDSFVGFGVRRLRIGRMD